MEDAEANCREVVERLFIYIDGEMEEADVVVFRRHLEACAHCLQHVDFEVEIKRIVRAKCQQDVPPHVVERVRAWLTEVRGSTEA